MAGNSIGSASLKIVPTFDGLTSKVNAALSGASSSASGSGEKLGQSTASGFGKGLATSGALVGAFASITSSAMSSISSHLSSAISRFDTLNNYPTVMQSLGYSADEASSSLSKMDEHLQGLPTSLDSMTSTVQGIVAVTGDLDQATEAGLALNDMLLASGSNTQLTSAAMEQFRQILAKGKPDMQDWKSLTSAMPGQMNQLAEAMLGTGATANDLYAALGGGGAEATISTNDLLNAMIKLDNEGADGITSFAEQAKTATGGVESSMANLETAITRGISNTMEAIGKENIATVFTDLKTAVNDAFSTVNSVISAAMPAVQEFYSIFKSNAGTIATAATSFGILQTASGALRTGIANLTSASKQAKDGFSTMKSAISGMGDTFSLMASGTGTVRQGLSALNSDAKKLGTGIKGVMSGLASCIDPVSVAIAGVSVAISAAVTAYTDWKTKTDNMTKATSGLNDAVSRASGLSTYSDGITGIGTSSGTAAKSVDELNEYIAKSVDTMNSTTSAAESSISQLTAAQRIIDEYAGKTDLSAEAQGKLQWALEQVNEQFNLSLTSADVANNAYDSNGEHVDNLKQKIDDLIAAKKQSIMTDALTSNLTQAYSDQAEAAKTLASAQSALETAQTNYDNAVANSLAPELVDSYFQDLAKAQKNMRDAQADMDSTTAACASLENQLGNASASAESLGSSLNALSSGQLAVVEGSLSNTGQSVTELGSALDALGVNTEQLAGKSDAELASIVNSFDGSTASIVGKLDEYGVAMDDAAKATAYSINDIKDVLNGDDGFKSAVEQTGATVNDFAEKLGNAGVSTEQLNSIGSANFAALAENCNYNTDQMVWAIQNYNNVPIVDKNGNVTVNDAQLRDSEGNIYVWNGTELANKETQVTANVGDFTDAQGNIYTWNGTTIEPKTATVTEQGSDAAVAAADNVKQHLEDIPDSVSSTINADDNASGTISSVWSSLDALDGKTATTHIYNYTHDITETTTTTGSGNATGGFRMNAAGGFAPRYHASGAIATKAVPLDIVGEDGAEAIVPLTNRKYSLPFAKTLAAQMGGGAVDAARIILAALPSIIADNAPNLVIDNDAGRMVVDTRLNQLQRKAAMNRG